MIAGYTSQHRRPVYYTTHCDATGSEHHWNETWAELPDWDEDCYITPSIEVKKEKKPTDPPPKPPCSVAESRNGNLRRTRAAIQEKKFSSWRRPIIAAWRRDKRMQRHHIKRSHL